MSRYIQVALKNTSVSNKRVGQELTPKYSTLDTRYRLFKVHEVTTGGMTGSYNFEITKGEFFTSYVKNGNNWYPALANADSASYYSYSITTEGWQSNPYNPYTNYTWTVEAAGVGDYTYKIFSLPTAI